MLFLAYYIPRHKHAPLQRRHNGRDIVSNHQPHHCLPNRLLGRRSTKTSNLRLTGLCVGNSPEIGEFTAQMASNAENVSIWWRHHVDVLWCMAVVWYMSFYSKTTWAGGQKSRDRRSRNFCPHRGPSGELIAQYRPPMSFCFYPTLYLGNHLCFFKAWQFLKTAKEYTNLGERQRPLN